MDNAFTNKIAFFNIPDLHAYFKLENRFDYNLEILGIIERLARLTFNYKEQGYQCIALLNGDVAHRGNANDSKNDYAVQAIKYLVDIFDDTYLNFGNHEFTYHKNNPIYKFIKEIEDPRVKRWYPHIKGLSTLPQIKSVTRLDFEDVEIVFTPYGMAPERGDKEISIAIMHDDIMSLHAYNKLRIDMPEYKLHRRPLTENLFDYVFCGHNHTVQEKWNLGTTQVYNISSLGRTSVTEVDDSFRTRMIPVIIIEDGLFKEVIDERITLHKREDIVDEVKVQIARENYELTKEKKRLKESLSISMVEGNPIEVVDDDIQHTDDAMLKIVWDILKQGRVVHYGEVKKKLLEELDDDGQQITN